MGNKDFCARKEDILKYGFSYDLWNGYESHSNMILENDSNI